MFLFKNAIANASTLAEVERLKGLLQAGQIPGRDRKTGKKCSIFQHLEGIADKFLFKEETRFFFNCS